MTRNLGGAGGIALLQTFSTKREQFHSHTLMDSLSLFEEATRTRLEQLASYFLAHGVPDRAEAWHQAVIAVGKVVRRQAYVMAYSDTFDLLGVALLVALLATLLLKRADHIGPSVAH